MMVVMAIPVTVTHERDDRRVIAVVVTAIISATPAVTAAVVAPAVTAVMAAAVMAAMMTASMAMTEGEGARRAERRRAENDSGSE